MNENKNRLEQTKQIEQSDLFEYFSTNSFVAGFIIKEGRIRLLTLGDFMDFIMKKEEGKL